MAKYTTNPVTVDAVRASDVIAAFQNDWQAAPDWVRAARDKGGVVVDATGVTVTTARGTQRAGVNDFIVLGAAGELYPERADVFATNYRAVATFDVQEGAVTESTRATPAVPVSTVAGERVEKVKP